MPYLLFLCFPAHLVSRRQFLRDVQIWRQRRRSMLSVGASLAGTCKLEIYRTTTNIHLYGCIYFTMHACNILFLEGFLRLGGGIIRPLLASRLTSAAEVLLERRGRSATIASTATSLPPVERSSDATKFRWRRTIPRALAARLTTRSRWWRWRRQLIAG